MLGKQPVYINREQISLRVTGSWILNIFSIPIGMKTLLKANLGPVLPEAELYVQFL